MLDNLEFRQPQYIWFLAAAAACVVITILAIRKKEKILALLHLRTKPRFKVLRATLLGIGMSLMVVALLGPQLFEGAAEYQKTGMDIYVLVDTSKSMLVTDIMPDRINVTKKMINHLLDTLDGDRVGFIPFASDAYIQMPLTDDYSLARMFLDVMDTDMISGGGTNLEAAIALANRSFDRSSGSDRVILIFSDGEEHDSDSINALKEVTDEKVKIYTIGVGTEKGGLIPIYADNGTTISDYMKDGSGNPVTSRLQPAVLQQLARDGAGRYYHAGTQGTEIYSLIQDLSTLERDTLSVEQMKKFEQLYQYFLGGGLLMVLAAWFLPERRQT